MGSPRTITVFLHRRIFLVFLFSIALPGVYIGYVGLRSLVQEQELQRGVLVQSLERTLEFEIDKLERKLEQTEEDVTRSLVASKSPLHLQALANFAASHEWLEEVFVFDSLLNLRGPLPFVSNRLLGWTPPVRETTVRDSVDAAARFELQGDYNGAFSSYQQLLREDLSLKSKIVLNTYLARAAAATGNLEVARRAYTAVIQADSTFTTTQPIPYAAFAWLEIVEDLARQKKTKEALQKSLQFYQRLLEFYSHFSSDQHRYFLQKIHSGISSLTTSSMLSDDIRNALSALEERERFLTRVLTRAGRIESWLQTQQALLYAEDSLSTIHHHSLTIEGECTPVSLVFINKPASAKRCVVFVVRSQELENRFFLPALQSGDWAKGFVIAVRRDSLGAASKQELISSKMHKTAVMFPSWEITVSSQKVSTVEIFGMRAPLLSIGFAFLVIGIISLGIFIIYRDVRREEELSKMKSEFISNVSHELKTPIAAIRMLADNLRESRIESEARRMEYYQLISKEGARLSHLIENILDFSRIEERRKAFRLERHVLSQIVSDTVGQFKSLVEERAQTISIDVAEALPEVLVDPDAIALALFNLLDNAVKYSERDTPISVRVRRSDNSLCIEVEDHGVGISKMEQEKIFEKFYRVHDNARKKIPGSGIGLTLVREIAQAHNGQAKVQSQLGVGSTFQILLPIGG
jgi:signal transduction histidine kinase/tetratricopeptide (TPR) repeat protein